MRRCFLFVLSLLWICVLETTVAEPLQHAPVSGETTEILITFAGDCTLGSEERTRFSEASFDSHIARYGMAYPFAKLAPLFSTDDLTVINLEGVFSDSESGRVQKTYNFRGPAAFAQILPVGGVELAFLGNNHSMDYGMAGFESTVTALEESGTAWFGSTPHSFKTHIFEKHGVRIGFTGAYIGFWVNNRPQLRATFEELRAAGCQVIVACMHGGVEYDPLHDKQQERMAAWFIKNGADLVVGHHPHVLQGIGIMDGRMVIYSLGNLSFGGNAKLRSRHTALAQLSFSFDASGKWLGYRLNLIPAKVSGADDYNDYQPALLSGKEATQALALIQKDTRFTLRPFVEGVGALQDFIPAPEEDS